MRFGLFIGLIVSPIVLGIIYFTLFTPISLVMKMFGRDELRLKISFRQSHWRLKDNSSFPKFKTFKEQF